MKIKTALIVVLLIISVAASFAQINVVVADFQNESAVLYLDSWERSVPDLIKTELSHTDGVVVLEREKLDAIFEEQRLALAGFINDSALVQQIGNLAGADVIISGSIFKLGKGTRIDVNITRVKTTEVITEKAEAPDASHLKEMIALLTNNIRYRLTGQGEYQERISIAGYPTKYFLAATAGFGIGAILANSSYKQNLDKYHDTNQIDKFDSYYDSANNAKKLTVALVSLGTVSLMGSLYCWIRNSATEDITAHSQSQKVTVLPGIGMSENDEVCLDVQIHF